MAYVALGRRKWKNKIKILENNIAQALPENWLNKTVEKQNITLLELANRILCLIAKWRSTLFTGSNNKLDYYNEGRIGLEPYIAEKPALKEFPI